MSTLENAFTPYATRITPSAIFGLASMPQAPDTINLGPGEPDPDMFPATRLAGILSSVLSDPAVTTRALQYGVNAGDPELRQRLCDYHRASGVDCTPENILITSGSQQALDLVTALLVQEGEIVSVQAPTYPGALGIFRAHGAVLEALQQTQARIRGEVSGGPALIYTCPNFCNPSGATMDRQQRQSLIDLTYDRSSFLIEDDAYETISFDGPPPPPVLELDLKKRPIDQSRVIYVSTFSKSLAPGLRVGWLVAARPIVEKLTLLKQTEDMQAGSLVQVCIANALDFVFDEHVPMLRDRYRRRRDAMQEALVRHFGGRARWTIPAGGFFFWLELPDGIDTTCLLSEAAMKGVTYVPGAACSHDGTYRNAMRLSFSNSPVDRLREGIRRLADAAGFS